MSTLNGASILAGINSGLNSTYALLAQQSSNGVTLASIANSQTTASKTGLNNTFASYMSTNFSSMDADKDGILSSTELTDTTNQLSTKGVTQAQLTQLGTASGLSAEALSDVLAHFAQIDTNGDGKVTSGEITAFNLTSAMEKKKIEFSNKAATNMSVFYGDDNAAAADDASLVAYKYLSDDK